MVSSFEREVIGSIYLISIDLLSVIILYKVDFDMKIKGGTEPPSNEIDKYALIINSLIAAVTRDDFIELLRFHTPLTTEAMVCILYYSNISIYSP